MMEMRRNILLLETRGEITMNRTSGHLIAHLSSKRGGAAFCGSRFACMSVTPQNTLGYQICKRCANRLAKMRKSKADKEAGMAKDYGPVEGARAGVIEALGGMKAKSQTYIVVENAGYEGERDVKRCISYGSTCGWLKQFYSESERESLHVAICVESDSGERSYAL
jgi:hypothetical protein